MEMATRLRQELRIEGSESYLIVLPTISLRLCHRRDRGLCQRSPYLRELAGRGDGSGIALGAVAI